MKIVKVSSLVLLLALSSIACSQKEDTHKEVEKKSETVDTSTEVKKAVPEKKEVESVEKVSTPEIDATPKNETSKKTSPAERIAEIAVNQTASMISIYAENPKITKEQKSCLKKIDVKSDMPAIKDAYANKLTEAEITQVLEVLDSPKARDLTAYSMQMAQLQSGIKIKNLIPKPTDAEATVKQMQEFSQSKLGLKLAEMPKLEKVLRESLQSKIKACGITPPA